MRLVDNNTFTKDKWDNQKSSHLKLPNPYVFNHVIIRKEREKLYYKTKKREFKSYPGENNASSSPRDAYISNKEKNAQIH